jgi:hypothetical protein
MKRLLFILALAFAGCSSHEIERIPIGRVVDANHVATSFNEAVKTQVKTEQRFVIVYGSLSVPFGVTAYLTRHDDGRTYFTWDGADLLYPAAR